MPNDEETQDAATATETSDEQLREAGKEALRKERERAKTAEARIRELEAAEAEREAKAKREADEKAAEQGEFKALAERRDAELNSTKESLKSIQADRDALADYFQKDYEASLKTLPEHLRDFAPDDDASTATKTAWLAKAKAAADKLEKASAKGNGQNPKTGSNNGIDEDAARAASQSRFRNAI